MGDDYIMKKIKTINFLKEEKKEEKYFKCILVILLYFRFSEYKNSEYFDGVFLNIDWLSYNFSLILLKLMHFAGIDDEIE